MECYTYHGYTITKDKGSLTNNEHHETCGHIGLNQFIYFFLFLFYLHSQTEVQGSSDNLICPYSARRR